MGAAIEPDERLGLRPYPHFGAEVVGLDLSAPLGPHERDRLRDALFRFKLLVFRDQALTTRQHEQFATQFGPLYLHPSTPGHPERPRIQLVRPPDLARLAQVKAMAGPGQISAGYHADTSWRLAPAWAGVLRPVDLPPQGGDTVWVDAERACATLDAATRRRLAGLHVAHDFRSSLARVGLDYPVVAHPIVRHHPVTGREALWVNFAARPRIVGVDTAENADLLTQILDRYEDVACQHRHVWRPGTVAFWDNQSTVHCAVQDYGDYPRLLERALILDDPPYAGL